MRFANGSLLYSRLAMASRALGWAAGAAVIATLIGVLAWGLSHPALLRSASATGRMAPDLTIQPFEGSPIALSDLRGQPVVINFYASWCPGCRQEAAVLSAAAANNPGVRFVGADIQDTAEAGRAFEAEVKHGYPTGPVTAGSYLRFGVTGPPETFFIDRTGRIAGHFAGPLDGPTIDVYLASIR